MERKRTKERRTRSRATDVNADLFRRFKSSSGGDRRRAGWHMLFVGLDIIDVKPR